MEIELRKISVKELADGYIDNREEGVKGFGGRLDIRPPYQREFIYKDKQRDAVVNTVIEKLPLNVMYWAVRNDGDFEIIDGQQRTISICQYIKGKFAYKNLYFSNLQNDLRRSILDYAITIYLCRGTDSERLAWFKIINIAGEKLADQELRNAVYSGPWLSDAKRYFSKNGCSAYAIGHEYLKGSYIRQDYLETSIGWISNGNIEDYMSQHQQDPNANALWRYFQDAISWIKTTFVIKRERFMKGVAWGMLYNAFKNKVYDTHILEMKIAKLILDDDVTNKRGIYPYVLTDNQRYLSIRRFSDGMKQKIYDSQKGICMMCKRKFDISQMEADHILPWHLGGKTATDNCQMLCKECNRKKSGQ